MPENARELSDKQQAAILALLQYPTIEAAAKVLNIDSSSIYRWLRNPLFKEAYQEAKSHVFEDALTDLKNSMLLAVNTLKTLVADETTGAAVKVRACEIIIKQAIEAHNSQDLQRKIDELEQLVKVQ